VSRLLLPSLRPTMERDDRFARNLRELRHEAGISQERLAYACSLHRTEISLLERAEREPRLSTIVRLARGLGVAPAALLEGIE
jgi:transcriptional regulator with XRE-family HTH domain